MIRLAENSHLKLICTCFSEGLHVLDLIFIDHSPFGNVQYDFIEFTAFFSFVSHLATLAAVSRFMSVVRIFSKAIMDFSRWWSKAFFPGGGQQ